MMEEQKDNAQGGMKCAGMCGGTCMCGCGCGWAHGHRMFRVIIGIIIAMLIFWLGVKAGELKVLIDNSVDYGMMRGSYSASYYPTSGMVRMMNGTWVQSEGPVTGSAVTASGTAPQK